MTLKFNLEFPIGRGPKRLATFRQVGEEGARRDARPVLDYCAPEGCRPVMTSIPVWAQKAPFSPCAWLVEDGQFFQ